MSFRCKRCDHAGRYSDWVTARWHSAPTVQRCERCGTPHACERGDAPVVIGPALCGIERTGLRLSPWVDARYVPYIVGAFECEWRDGATLRLWWDGRAWTWCGKRVDTSTMMKWRGRWAESQ